MLFNSYIFIFLFLPLALVGWFFLNRIEKYRTAQYFLIAMSLWFYGYFNPGYLWIILGSSLFNFLFSALIEVHDKKCVTDGMAKKGSKWFKRLMLVLGCVVNLGILGYFKYYDFFLENINALFKTDWNLKHILLPLGISFFTFQQLSFAIDRCKGDAPHYNLADYLCFVTFFPQLIAGPIVLHSELIPQFQDKERRRFSIDSFGEGIVYFTIGMAKKVLLADTLGKMVNFGYDNVGGIDTISAVVVAVAYSFELYFDFSGYCDMAIGLGKMFHMDIPDNFDSPYKAVSVKDIWRRWHMTLGRFFTTYVYFPLGGSKKGRVRTVINTMIVFTLSGLWHGANWTYVLWGVISGMAVSVNALTEKRGEVKTGIRKFASQAATYVFWTLSIILFRSDSLHTAGIYFKSLFSFRHYGSLKVLAENMPVSEFYIINKVLDMTAKQYIPYMNLAVLFLVLAIGTVCLAGKKTSQIVKECTWSRGFAFKIMVLFVWSVISLSGVSTFLYFNF